jgi:AICAR transformylase/IMP cyclohydrolase PurH (only IMP cyclohydrolase domain in Aful)
MVRASAKNHANVIICCNPNDYESIIEDLTRTGGNPSGVPITRRQDLALTAYQHTAAYDVAIANTLHERWNGVPESFDAVEQQSSRFHETLLASSIKMETLRYGENAHQSAALFVDDAVFGNHSTLVTAHVEGGKAMSYNNYSDADATLRLCRSLSTDEWPETPHACVIVKHNNPCGVALASNQVDAYTNALASDPESAFGSIICFNEIVTLDTAQAMAELFIEVLIAPGYTDDAKEFIMKKGNRRLLTIDSPNNRLAPLERKRILKQIEGGWIVQTEEASNHRLGIGTNSHGKEGDAG